MPYNPKQVPIQIGYYLAGFTDGEGSFSVVFRKRPDYNQAYKVSLCFNVSQKEKVILALFKKHLACGTLIERPDGIWYYEVNNFNSILQNVIPFFKHFSFLSAKKKKDFAKFVQIAQIIQEERHLTKEGIAQILRIRKEMNNGGANRRKYADEDILQDLNEKADFKNPQRLHAKSTLSQTEKPLDKEE
ncbi:LAGLIDADG family homing endonuclease [Hugenholtzia roseola]|uniref:LAGLIDADG family homing endonuclease n=1 Tax=Hugenholtzia roseola TaxID=1002 RepID=UPI00047E45BB|nr:LAGLIDADG family homing endonuclease [Hugenholtzia roseola]